jgi:hypothetical protein
MGQKRRARFRATRGAPPESPKCRLSRTIAGKVYPCFRTHHVRHFAHSTPGGLHNLCRVAHKPLDSRCPTSPSKDSKPGRNRAPEPVAYAMQGGVTRTYESASEETPNAPHRGPCSGRRWFRTLRDCQPPRPDAPPERR